MSDAKDPRDIDGDYRAAYIFEYETAKRAGRDETAAEVAEILRSRYGHEVEPTPEPEPEPAPVPAPEAKAEKTEDETPRQKRQYNRRQQAPERADGKAAPEHSSED